MSFTLIDPFGATAAAGVTSRRTPGGDLIVDGLAAPVTIAAGALHHVLSSPPPGLAALAQDPAAMALTASSATAPVCLVYDNENLRIHARREAPGLISYRIYHDGQCIAVWLDAARTAMLSDAWIGRQALLLDALAQAADIAALIPVEPPFPARTGLLSSGFLHFGHAIWDELHCVDDLVRLAAAPEVYFVPGESALDIYGALEELYPETAGAVFRAPSRDALLRTAAERGTTLLWREGRMATQSVRRRLGSRLDRWEAETGDAPLAGGRPVIAFGIRLCNRCPEDAVGLYQRLARRLRQAIGPFTLVLDGMNRAADGGEAAANVYNGAQVASSNPRDLLKAGGSELDDELEWASAFISTLDLPDVEVVNGIGTPILENLSWLRRASVFVAPFGAGLAKLRWALDVPGFVLTSAINLDYCWALTIYNDEKYMEAPFSDLAFTAVDEVADTPLDGGRAGTPEVRGIPHPENFRVDEDKVTPRLVDFVRRHLASGVKEC